MVHSDADARFKGKQNYSGAVKLFKRAIAGGEADASYQMAQLLLLGLLEPSNAALEYAADVVGSTTPSLGIARSNQKGALLRQIAVEREALEMIEVAAAAGASNYGGATKAMYNLGVIWLYGYGGVARDPTLAAAWFKMSAIPEGLMVRTYPPQTKNPTIYIYLYLSGLFPLWVIF